MIQYFQRDQRGEVSVEMLTFMFKVLVIMVLVFQLSIFLIQVTFVKMAVDEIVRKAECEGRVDEGYMAEQFRKRHISTAKLRRINSTPAVGTFAAEVGEPIFFEVHYEYSVQLMGTNFQFTIPIGGRGVNQGYVPGS